MKKYLVSIFVILLCCTANAIERNFEGGADYSGVVSFEDYDTVRVYGGAVVSSPGNTIIMNDTVYLYNYGRIDGIIDTNGNTLIVYNSGIMGGGINPHGGLVKQVIRSEAEITNIGMPANQKPVVSIESYDMFDFNRMTDISAESVIIKNSSVVLDNFSDWQMCTENIELSGNVSLIINNPDSVQSGQIIKYTKSGSKIFVQINNLDKMYKPELQVANGGIVLNIVRETNYSAIFGDGDSDDKKSAALETLRGNNSDDKLLKALDAADNMDEIRRLENLSYRFNHGILLRPVKMINKFSLSGLITGEAEYGVGIVPHYIISDKINSVGARLYAGYKFNNVYLSAGVTADKFDYVDELNEFSGMAYGLDIESRQIINRLWVNEIFGLTLTNFKADYISEKGQIKTNPFGFSWYGDVSLGYDFDVAQDITVAPVLGLAYQSYSVADVSDTDTNLHAGVNVKYFFVVDGVKYEYSLSGGLGTNRDIFVDMGIGFVSVTDNAGVSLNASVLNDDFDYYYKLSLNAKIVF